MSQKLVSSCQTGMKAAGSLPLGNVREGLLQKHCDGDHLLIVLPFSP